MWNARAPSMSEHHIEIVRLGAVDAHPNADALDITLVHGGYPCIVKRGQFQAGDLAVYIPEDSLVPTDRAEFAFLASKAKADGRARIKAMRLRGVFSMGLLIAAPEGVEEGQDVAVGYGITRYEPPETSGGWGPGGSMTAGRTVAPPSPEPPVYDLEPLRKYHRLFAEGEEVVLTEKLHGANGRCFVADDGSVHIGSHKRWVDPESPSEWGDALKRAIPAWPPGWRGFCVYFEVIGKQGGFPYGREKGGSASIRVFDVLDVRTRRWFDHDALVGFCLDTGLPMVPVVYRGPWLNLETHAPLAEGPSTLDAAHIREGFVARPVCERLDLRAGRVVLKFVGQGYLLGKG